MPEAMLQKTAEAERVFETYRRWGYLAANLDPLGFLAPLTHPELIVEGPAAESARKFYCGTIGAEFVHIDDTARRRWIAERLESEAPLADRAFLLERLIRAESVRAGAAGALSGHQAIFAGRHHRADSAAGPRSYRGGAAPAANKWCWP